MKCIAWINGGHSATENMTIDHQMLEAAEVLNAVLMRVYEWKEPTQSLGYFQKFEQRAEHVESQSLPSVRRSTGGGAIVHHHDWTYSIALPPSAKIGEQAISSTGASQGLYDCVHDAVIAWLKSEYRLAARKWDSSEPCSTSGCAFLCFERRAIGDVVLGESKIMGSAQRRHRGSLLQHGSLLLRQSRFASSLMGLKELSSDQAEAAPFNADGSAKAAFSNSIFNAVADRLKLDLERIENGVPLIAEFPRGSYASDEWKHKR
ncbi:MAG: lipoyl protein ligase domain-containing protein [Aureliella sp.]